MDKIFLFDLASRQAGWASVRQATIATNIANANTPGYLARDIEPFSTVLERTHLATVRTSPGHIDLAALEGSDFRASEQRDAEVSESGNSVSLDQEMFKADEVARTFSLNTSIVRAFHRMVLASVRTA